MSSGSIGCILLRHRAAQRIVSRKKTSRGLELGVRGKKPSNPNPNLSSPFPPPFRQTEACKPISFLCSVLACVTGAKRGVGGGREKGKREGSACSKSLPLSPIPLPFFPSSLSPIPYPFRRLLRRLAQYLSSSLRQLKFTSVICQIK